MKKIILTVLLLFVFVCPAYSRNWDWYKEYEGTSEVNYLNLNGNLRNGMNVVNGGIENTNIDDDFQLIEIVGSLPVAGNEGRCVYLTTSNTFHFDDGSAWVEVPTYAGEAVQGDTTYFNGTVWTRLAAGTVGNTLKTGGAGANPSWASLNLAGGSAYVTGTLPEGNGGTGVTSGVMIEGDSAGGDLTGTYPNPTITTTIKNSTYFAPDSTCIIALDHGGLGVDLTPIHNVITLTSLADANLVAGKVSPKCYDFDGANDYLLIAHHALQAGSSSITLEAWVYADSTAGTHTIICNDVNSYIRLQLTNTNIIFHIDGTVGNEAGTVAHGLSASGANQWIYIVVTGTLGTAFDVYVNGADVGNGDGNGSGTVEDSAAGIYLGADADEANKFNGKIDGARILRRAMSAAEALARYNAFK